MSKPHPVTFRNLGSGTYRNEETGVEIKLSATGGCWIVLSRGWHREGTFGTLAAARAFAKEQVAGRIRSERSAAHAEALMMNEARGILAASEATPNVPAGRLVHLVRRYHGGNAVCGTADPEYVTTERLFETTCPRCKYDGDPVARTRALQVEEAHAEALEMNEHRTPAEFAEMLGKVETRYDEMADRNIGAQAKQMDAWIVRHQREHRITPATRLDADHAEALGIDQIRTWLDRHGITAICRDLPDTDKISNAYHRSVTEDHEEALFQHAWILRDEHVQAAGIVSESLAAKFAGQRYAEAVEWLCAARRSDFRDDTRGGGLAPGDVVTIDGSRMQWKVLQVRADGMVQADLVRGSLLGPQWFGLNDQIKPVSPVDMEAPAPPVDPDEADRVELAVHDAAQEVTRAQALAAIGRVWAGVAKDVRAPFNAGNYAETCRIASTLIARQDAIDANTRADDRYVVGSNAQGWYYVVDRTTDLSVPSAGTSDYLAARESAVRLNAERERCGEPADDPAHDASDPTHGHNPTMHYGRSSADWPAFTPCGVELRNACFTFDWHKVDCQGCLDEQALVSQVQEPVLPAVMHVSNGRGVESFTVHPDGSTGPAPDSAALTYGELSVIREMLTNGQVGDPRGRQLAEYRLGVAGVERLLGKLDRQGDRYLSEAFAPHH